VRLKSRLKRSSILEMVLDEGRNREVRRLLARVGHKVQRLTRVAVGPIRLGDLPRGAVRKLSAEEVRKLKAAASGPGHGTSPPQGATEGRPPRLGFKPRRRPVAAGRETRRATGEGRRAIIGRKPGGGRPRPPRRRPEGQP
jgi:23S rRNA pseudouridine2605 synthase